VKRIAATLAAGATSLALLALNFIPRRSVIITDEGPWPDSWNLQFGWPSTSYTSFGYDARTRMGFWMSEGLAANALVASLAVTLAALLARAVMRSSRP
jgi:hypothetical protein